MGLVVSPLPFFLAKDACSDCREVRILVESGGACLMFRFVVDYRSNGVFRRGNASTGKCRPSEVAWSEGSGWTPCVGWMLVNLSTARERISGQICARTRWKSVSRWRMFFTASRSHQEMICCCAK